MNKIRLTKIFHFETAHALYGYDGKCKNIHGHSYSLEVSILGEPIEDASHPKNGMVMDFGDLKSIVQKYIVSEMDHAILLNNNSPHEKLAKTLETEGHKVKAMTYQPTCENMLLDFVRILQNELPKNVQLVALKLKETESSYSEWLATDQ